MSYILQEAFENSLSGALTRFTSTDKVTETPNIPLKDMNHSRSPSETQEGFPLVDEPLSQPPHDSRWKRRVSSIFSSTNPFKKGGINLNHVNDDNTSESTERVIFPNMDHIYPSNGISNAKYNGFTFLPMILYEQFKFFFNLYFLIVALSQAVPQLRIGYLSSYIVPLAFVLIVTMSKEAMDDIQRRRRDKEQNDELYEVVGKTFPVRSRDLKCGDLVRIHKDTRVPADLILLQSSEDTGEAFIKTDQLDGETDWKLRVAAPRTQDVSFTNLEDVRITVGPPTRHIHEFFGRLDFVSGSNPLTIDNTMWANTVLASGSAIGCIIYTGSETRQAMNTSSSKAKTGLLELEINSLSKILCVCVFVLSVVLVAANGFGPKWYIDVMRFLILFSTIVPVSLRVNLDIGKSVYAHQIEHDPKAPGIIVRTSTIPEDLGRIEYLLSDKTGTLTQNDMQLKKLHLGSVSYAGDTMDMVSEYVVGSRTEKSVAARRDMGTKVRELVLTLAICHNVTPSIEDGEISYQAASPDEIAIVRFTQSVGMSLFKRDRSSMVLSHNGNMLNFDILYVFPFTSVTKRMGIIVKDSQGEIWFMEKGADTVMSPIVQQNDWLDEETSNMAREGLRTLVIARKKLSLNLFEAFKERYTKASLLMQDRDHAMSKVVEQFLETELELLGLTGVEDKLQNDVKQSIELLENAGVKIWMLTGDKVETAKCVAISAKLITRGQYVHQVTRVNNPEGALSAIAYLRSDKNCALLIDGESLGTFLTFYRQEFFHHVVHLPAVIACRCSPQQKADVALLIRQITKKRVCCIGDGGNDVNMIQSADVGVGIVGKEGKQASLAADFSIIEFRHLSRLLLWHGRNSYKRSAKLAQFVIHRGLLISVCQAVYSISSSFAPLALYQGWLMVGYATVYTMAPVFSLVWNKDVDEGLAAMYPELYHELTEGKSLSYKTFFLWVVVSLYQGCVIQLLSQAFVGINTDLFTKMVAVSFTGLVLNELIMVALEIHKWAKIMISAEVVTFAIYIASVPFLGDYFDLHYVASLKFVWQVGVVLVIALLPVWLVKAISRRVRPPNYAKVQGV